MQFRNWKGELVEAPEDNSEIIATSGDGQTVVWSFEPDPKDRLKVLNRHKVRYALQTKICTTRDAAAKEFAECLSHMLSCQGMKD